MDPAQNAFSLNQSSAGIRGLLFSYDRAMQLDATLRSLRLHCQDCDNLQLTVLYKASAEHHRRQYTYLANLGSGIPVQFVPEAQFRRDVLNFLLPNSVNPESYRPQRLLINLPPALLRFMPMSLFPAHPGFVFFMVDDALFTRDFRLSDIGDALDKQRDALGFSLRLGRNTLYCYTKNTPQKLPGFIPVSHPVYKYRWTEAEYDFRYPLEISSSIYRLEDIWKLALKLAFHNPNLFEGRMANRARDFTASKPYLLCYEQSVAFCNPINIVQKQSDNRSGKRQDYTPETLARMFDAGYRIDVKAYSGFTPNSCHQEVELIFEKDRKLG